MFDTLLKYLDEHWPKLTVVIILLVFAIIVTWKIAMKYIHWTNRVKNNEADCKKIDSHVIPQLTSLNVAVSSLVVYLKTKDKGMDTTLFQTKSPFRLTPLGEEILNVSGGKKFIDENLSYLISEINKQSIKSALDAENMAALVINSASNLDSFTPIKDFIFNTPIYKSGDLQTPLDLSKITNILGIYLRDKFLQVHQDLLKGDTDYSFILSQ